jgi:hypothetical protein
MRKFRRSSNGSRSRLIVLGAVLALTSLWAFSELGPRGPERGRGGHASPRGMAEAASAPEPAATGDQATPEGWGTDPFDPRALGFTPATTGR